MCLCRSSEARAFLYEALKEDILLQTRAPQLSSLGTVMSMHRPWLKIKPEHRKIYADEVTKAERLTEFNPVDLTGIYNTLIRLDVR